MTLSEKLRRLAPKVYLGDGVYVEVEHGMLKLTTDRGRDEPDTIYLETNVYRNLREYFARPEVLHALGYDDASSEDG